MTEQESTPVPALYFVNDDDAREALLTWATAQAALDEQRDIIVLGAKAVDVKGAEVTRLTHIAATTINRMPAVPVAIQFPPVIEYAQILRTRSAAHQALADRTTQDGGRHQSTSLAYRLAAQALSGESADSSGACLTGVLSTDDARLAALAATYRRDAAGQPMAASTPWDRGFSAGFRDTLLALAEEITRIRTVGEEALDTEELAEAHRALKAEGDAHEAGLLGMDPATYAALDGAGRAAAWAAAPETPDSEG